MRKSLAIMPFLVFLASSYLIVSLPVKADFRTLVVPDDYPTISSAIGTATAGDTIFVKKGTYEEKTLEIEKSLTLIGEDSNNAIIKLYPPYNETMIISQSFYSYSNAITINANNVKLSNLTIVIASPGGYITAIGDMTQIIGNNIVTGPETGLVVNGSYCSITDNISGGSINLAGFHNIIARNFVYGITVNKNLNAISNNTVSRVQLSNANNNIIHKNNISTTTVPYGVHILENSSHNIIHNNNILALLNDVKINSNSAENNTFYHNNFLIEYSNEPVHLYTYNLTLVNFWDNGKVGNYWEDYNGTDANNDGIGDTPYVIDSYNIDNYPLMFPYDIENDTVVSPTPEIFPTILFVVSIVIIIAIGVGLLVYFKKRKR